MPTIRTWLAASFAAIAGLCLAPRPVSAEPLFAQVSLNGADTGEVLAFESLGGAILASAPTLQRLGLRRPRDMPPDGGALTPLTSITGLSYQLDVERQHLMILADPDTLQGHLISQAPAALRSTAPAAFGAALNYGASVLKGPGDPQAMISAEARVFGPAGVVSSSFLYRRSPGYGDDGLRRLDTAYVRYDEARARRLAVGDFITAGLTWAEPVRAAGISLSTDATLRPDIPTTIAPELSGKTATPSNIDVYVDGLRRFGGGTPAGPFEVDMAPVADGRGEISLVVTDAEGRRTVRSFPFYSDSELLRPGARALTMEFGAIREDYATDQDRYSDGFVAVAGRRGVTNALTIEFRAVGAAGVQTAGLGVVGKVREAALVSAAFAASHGPQGSGGMIFLAARHDTANYSLFASTRQRSSDFEDLSDKLAGFRMKSETLVGGSFRTSEFGSFSASYNDLRNDKRNFRLASAGWSNTFGRFSLFANGLASLDGDRRYSATVGLSAPLGVSGRSISAAAGSDGRDARAGVQIAQSSEGPSGWAWRASADSIGQKASDTRLEGEVRRITPAGEFGVGLAQSGGSTFVRAYSSGGVAWLEGEIFAANQIGESFALVDTGAANVAITLENRTVGVTNARGRLIVPRMSSQGASKLAVKVESVGLNDTIEVQDQTIRPSRGAGVMVRLPVTRARSAIIRLIGRGGEPIPVGLQVRLNGQPSGVTGFDGEAFATGLGRRNTLDIFSQTGACRMEFEYEDATQGPPTLGPYVCDLSGSEPPLAPYRHADSGARGAELHSADTSGEFRELRSEVAPSQHVQRDDRGEVHLLPPRLHRSWVRSGDFLRSIWVDVRQALAPGGPEQRRASVWALSRRDPPPHLGNGS